MSQNLVKERAKEIYRIEDLLECLNLKGLKLVHSYIRIMNLHINKIYALKGAENR